MFKHGDIVEFRGDRGFVNFYDKHSPYFTLCVRQWEDPGKMHGVSQCNLLVYRSHWDEVKMIEPAPVVDTYHSQEHRYSDPQ